ncbi:HD domain-containing protein [Clostridium beijerinckii]|uniref:HD domain-containing protein n=1 Tax=Clostridium beijerinckii TaxID=1520 RepID=UPI0004794A8C|nr:HD domain-containing protein [Clostridium beijerinckii]
MFLYRIRQFYWAIESIFIKEDLELLKIYLSASELNLFMKLTKSERQHSIRVYKTAIKYIEDNNIVDVDKNKMSKCALLHDIGKSEAKLNIFYKGIIVIINSITCGKFLKYNKNKKVISYYNHPEIGAKLLESINTDEYFDIINSIKYHHNESSIGTTNIYLKILSISDNCN